MLKFTRPKIKVDKRRAAEIEQQRELGGSAWEVYALLNLTGEDAETDPNFQAATRFSHLAVVEHPSYFTIRENGDDKEKDATTVLAERCLRQLLNGFPWINDQTRNYDIRMQPVCEAIKDRKALPVIAIDDIKSSDTLEKTEVPAIIDLSVEDYPDDEVLSNLIKKQIDARPFVIIKASTQGQENGSERSVLTMIVNHKYLDGVPVAHFMARVLSSEQASDDLAVDLTSIEQVALTDLNGGMRLRNDNEEEGLRSEGPPAMIDLGPHLVTETGSQVLLNPNLHPELGDSSQSKLLDLQAEIDDLLLQQLHVRSFIVVQVPIDWKNRRRIFHFKIQKADLVSHHRKYGNTSLTQLIQERLIEKMIKVQSSSEAESFHFVEVEPTDDEFKKSDEFERFSTPGSTEFQVRTERLNEEIVNLFNEMYAQIREQTKEYLYVTYNDFLQIAILSYFGTDGESVKGGVLKFDSDPHIQLDHFEVGNAQALLQALLTGDKRFIADYLAPIPHKEYNPATAEGVIDKDDPDQRLRALQRQIRDRSGNTFTRLPNLGLYRPKFSSLAVVRSVNKLIAETAMKFNIFAKKFGIDAAIPGQVMVSVLPKGRLGIGYGTPACMMSQDVATTATVSLNESMDKADEIIMRVKMRKEYEETNDHIRDYSPYAKRS